MTIKDNVLYGNYNFLNNKIDVSFNLEEIDSNNISLNSFSQILTTSKQRISILNNDNFSTIKNQISKEIVDSAYSQSDYKPNKEDYQNLFGDLDLKGINFFNDCIVFIFNSSKHFPEMFIYSQIDDNMEIEDVYIENR